MLGWTPANMRVATPSPMADTPSVAMNEGTFSSTRASPLRQPNAQPSTTATRMPSSPKSLSLRLLATRSDTVRAEAPITPAEERSMDPIISTNVMPQVTTASTAAASMMFWAFPMLRNCGLRAANTR